MKWALLMSLLSLILFGPWFVFLAERKQIRWLKPLSYFCLFLGPALAVIGVINHRRIQAKEAEITKAGGTVKTYYTTDTFGPGPKSQTRSDA
ncbi:MAG: hypothetical protein EBZ83_01600 [Verrucomicrobia bacterium]|nr:hypothetical protein [Verrucomicrobiota bacterium]